MRRAGSVCLVAVLSVGWLGALGTVAVLQIRTGLWLSGEMPFGPVFPVTECLFGTVAGVALMRLAWLLPGRRTRWSLAATLVFASAAALWVDQVVTGGYPASVVPWRLPLYALAGGYLWDRHMQRRHPAGTTTRNRTSPTRQRSIHGTPATHARSP